MLFFGGNEMERKGFYDVGYGRKEIYIGLEKEIVMVVWEL